MKKQNNKIEYISINKLIPYARNARKHSKEQVQQIADSIKEFGFLNPIIIADDGTLIAGHGRLMAANILKLKEVPCIKASNLTETQRKAYVLVDNRLAETSSWDTEMLRIELEDLKINLDYDLGPLGFSSDEIKNLLGNEQEKNNNNEEKDEKDSKYTKKIEAPIYEITGEKPEINELYNMEKTIKLLEKINSTKLSSEEKKFLTFAAYRHIIFNYAKIAEFYAQSNVEIQNLMEESALVIIDLNKAIENGFMTMTKEIANIYGEVYNDE